jgi:tetrahydromethanopterin S-methyltransferase subunit G
MRLCDYANAKRQSRTKGVKKMDCEIEINELKERVAKLEHRLEDVKAEVKTLFNQMERDSAGLR